MSRVLNINNACLLKAIINLVGKQLVTDVYFCFYGDRLEIFTFEGKPSVGAGSKVKYNFVLHDPYTNVGNLVFDKPICVLLPYKKLQSHVFTQEFGINMTFSVEITDEDIKFVSTYGEGGSGRISKESFEREEIAVIKPDISYRIESGYASVNVSDINRAIKKFKKINGTNPPTTVTISSGKIELKRDNSVEEISHSNHKLSPQSTSINISVLSKINSLSKICKTVNFAITNNNFYMFIENFKSNVDASFYMFIESV